MKRDFISIPGFLSILFSLSMLFTSCGGDQSAADTTAGAEKPKSMVADEPATKEPIVVSADGSTVTVNLTGNDAMQYNIKTIEVKAGQKIKLNLVHIGKMEKAVMGHNFVLLKPGTNIPDFGTKAATSSATEYIPESEMASVIVYTKLIGGGESTSIEFDAPAPGTYKYICSFPGHYGLMQGDLIVK